MKPKFIRGLVAGMLTGLACGMLQPDQPYSLIATAALIISTYLVAWQ